MINQPIGHLSGEEIEALKFAARRQLTRWAQRAELSPRQHTHCAALARTLRILDDRALAHGCELRAAAKESLDV